MWNEGDQLVKTVRSSDVNALIRGLAVLESYGTNGARELTLTELARRTALSKTTAFRLVRTLVHLGFMKQDKDTEKYFLAPRVLGLGYSFLEGLDLRELASPYLKELSGRCGETVNMAVLDGNELVYVERLKTQQIVNINLHIGSRLALYNTSMGRALIAHKPEAWLRAYIAQLPPEAEEYARKGGKKLLAILRGVREKQYAVNNEDLARGLRSVAAQVRNSKGEVVAAVNIAVPSARVSLEELEKKYALQLLRTAREISASLGCRETK
jgi:IclR family transcriptional regulator, pca regulon regulatory protein